jgi:hypothetical protein
MRSGSELAPYCARVAVGLLAFAGLAIGLHAYLAAETIVAAVIVALVTTGSALLSRNAEF